MPTSGYYRYPTLFGDTITFVSEDDLWSVPAGGGVARRLTANLGQISHPFYAPDGATLAFTGREEGHNEVYVMPATGGPIKRLTYLGVGSSVVGWTQGGRILFASDSGQPFDRIGVLFSVDINGGTPEPLGIGPAVSVSMGQGGRVAIGRNNNDPARWKRYRGGTAGQIWIDVEGSGTFRRLTTPNGNVGRPMWIGERLFFLSDHEGIGNIYSCLANGSDLTRHTSHSDFYVRFPSSDGRRIVYHAGADLFLLDPAKGEPTRVNVDYPSPRVHRQRRFIRPERHIEGFAPHPKGHSIALNVRGNTVTLGNFEGPATQLAGMAGDNAVRQRLTAWLKDGERLVTVADLGDADALEIHHGNGSKEPIQISETDIGRPFALEVSPTHDHVLLANHRNELIFVDLEGRTGSVVERSTFGMVAGFVWSPDGNWAAYGLPISSYQTAIKLWSRATGEITQITEPILQDFAPAFDPEGKYLYFLGMRELNPVYDSLHFDLGFPKGIRPYLITLREDLRSPFSPVPRPLADEPAPEPKPATPTPDEEATGEAQTTITPTAPGFQIDVNGIVGRVVAFPIAEGLYGKIAGIKGKVLFSSHPVEGALGQRWESETPAAKATLECYDMKELKQETLVTAITTFELSADLKTAVLRAGNRLRAVKAGEKPEDKPGEAAGRKSGWIDLKRVKISVEPGREWRQMAREAWRLQREYFWTEDMSRVDWQVIWERYSPLIERVGTRGELSDLMWEMQGELGTSHAYEMGGDYRPEPSYPIGFLGADFVWDSNASAFRFERIVRGAAGEAKASSPLAAPGVNVREGDLLIAVNGRRLDHVAQPNELLVHQADSEVALTVRNAAGEERSVTVKALKSEFPARYREWVEGNRRAVHERSNGRVGYVHIPDMGANGYAEFHRLYLAEVQYDSLIVDVRFNRGGHVSPLILEKLARRRVGYDVQRWGEPEPYPPSSVAGPMVALTNQFAGSDGDIVSHCFKLMKLGPLIGTRTWGGVIGIWPRNRLADGSITTQPEFSFWFTDVGWKVENYGTDPDIEVDIAPQDYAAGRDPQLDKAIEVVLDLLERNPPLKPKFDDRPSLALPKLQ